MSEQGREQAVEVARRHYVVLRAALVVAVAVALLVAAGAIVYTQVQKAREISCIEKWAQGFSDAYAIRVGAAGERQDALDELVRSITFDKARQAKAYTAYIAASDRYSKLAVEHPFPPSPKVACR